MSSETLKAIETTTQVAVENKPKKRGRKPGKNRKGYFYEEEEAAFVKYITSTDQAERNKLFNEKLLPAFTKMIESIIRRYDLFTPSEDFTDTFYDTLSFLITKVNNFDVTKGYKVYSYCGTVCKNYLILKRTTYMKQRDRFYPYDEVFLEPPQRNDDDKKLFNWNLNEELIDGMKNEIDGILNKEVVLEKKLTKNEEKVGYALLELLSHWDNLFKRMGSTKFNKTSVLYFIKEYTLLSTTEVREASRRYKEMYYNLKEKLLKE